ncbi:MAG: signal peptidase I [Clostridia bacterium]|nr:signal peptidase I [Clostridia bacterium]MBQ7113433.1 signal peptidase I [Clostridia bacterium]
MAEKIDKTLRAALLKDAEAIHAKDAPYKRAADKEFILWLVIVLALALAVRLFVFEPVRVVGDSMHDTLVNGERMLVEKVSYLFREPQRSDIIICFYPHHTTSCVKRVIGIGGDTVAIRDGILYLNGEKLDESAYWEDRIDQDMEEYIVPEGHVFVVGDNRNESSDSRSVLVGAIPLERVVGKVIGVVWPLDEARRV